MRHSSNVSCLVTFEGECLQVHHRPQCGHWFLYHHSNHLSRSNSNQLSISMFTSQWGAGHWGDSSPVPHWEALAGSTSAFPEHETHATIGDPQSIARSASEFPLPPDAVPVRRRKAPTLRDSDWEPMKDRITQLYIRDKLTLSRMAEVINSEFNLQPQRRYVTSMWGIASHCDVTTRN